MRDVEDVVPYQRVFIFPVGAIHESPVLCAIGVCFRDVEDVVPYQCVFIVLVGAIHESPVLKTNRRIIPLYVILSEENCEAVGEVEVLLRE